MSSKLCIFETEADVESMRTVTQVFERMIRQYKYLEKSLDEEMTKVWINYFSFQLYIIVGNKNCYI